MRTTALTLSLGVLALAALPATAHSQERDPLKLYPGNYKVLFENDRVRVLDFRLAKGATENFHSHPANVAVFLTDVNIRFTLPDGQKRFRVAHAGDVSYGDATTHASENLGDGPAHGIIVELKQSPAPDDQLVTAFTLIHGIPGHEEDLKQHLLSLAAPTRAEPGSITYDLYQRPDRKHEFLRFEVWSSIAALEAHKQMPHLRTSFAKRQREGWTTEIVLWNRVPEGGTTPDVGRIERLDPRLDSLIPPGAIVETVAEDIVWAEGPLWDARDGSLLFSDVPRNGVFRWKEGAGVMEVLPGSGYSGTAPFLGREPGSNGLVFDLEGRLVMCQHGDRRIVRRELDGRVTVLADRYLGKRLNSPNDLVYGPNGDLYFTDPPFGLPRSFDDPAKELPFQGVYRLRPDGRLTAVVTDLKAPNGIGFSPDGKTLYVSNSDRDRPTWFAYPVLPDGSVGPGRQFAEAAAWVMPGEGVPDGLKLDRNGNIFAAGPGGIHVFAPDGTRLGRIETGVPTGNLNWGEDGSVLYIAANHRILRLRTTTKGEP